LKKELFEELYRISKIADFIVKARVLWESLEPETKERIAERFK
jgi:hypothetical protein